MTAKSRVIRGALIVDFVATLFAGAAFAQAPASTAHTTVPNTNTEVKAGRKAEKTEAKVDEKIAQAKAEKKATDAKADAKDHKTHAQAHAKAEKKIAAAEHDVKKSETVAGKK